MTLDKVSSRIKMNSESRRESNTRLSGRWLVLARVGWVAVVVFILIVFFGSLPDTLSVLHQPCSSVWCGSSVGQLSANQIQTLPLQGFSLDAYAWFWLALNVGTAFVWFAVGGILFWRKSDDWMALLVSLMLISFGANNATGVLLYSSSSWRIPENGVQVVNGLSILFTLALFPNGRFVPRWTLWVTLINPVYEVVYILFLRQLRIPGWALDNNPFNAIAWFGCWIVLTLAQLYRYFRGADVLERQQIKWVAYSFFIVMVVGFFGEVLIQSLSIQLNGFLAVLFNNSFSIISLLIPISLGLAMFRYRLWDIDIIINRTLVYGTLTLILTGVYVGLIVGLQVLLAGVVRQNNSVAIVVSTLVIAALFQPLRRRIQRVIDRRFYRSKYDSTKIVAAFSATLRQEVDLDTLRERLVGVVQETMQPTHVSLWLRPTPQDGKGTSWRANPPVLSDER